MKHIEDLLERYFEGLTSAEEEKRLRHFFTSDDVPEKLAMHKPLFAYFDAEIKKTMANPAVESEHLLMKVNPNHLDATDRLFDGSVSTADIKKQVNSLRRRKILGFWISGVAACVALLVGFFFFSLTSEKCSGNGNYVIINGRCYTDDATVRAAALKTLREMSDDDSEFFFENDNDAYPSEKSSGTADFIQKQLSEFDSLFDKE